MLFYTYIVFQLSQVVYNAINPNTSTNYEKDLQTIAKNYYINSVQFNKTTKYDHKIESTHTKSVVLNLIHNLEYIYENLKKI